MAKTKARKQKRAKKASNGFGGKSMPKRKPKTAKKKTTKSKKKA